jgi:hypothetical protein
LIMAIAEPRTEQPAEAVIRECAAALQRIATYRLPFAVDRRLLWLSENKERLTPEERDELLEVVEFAQERSAEKSQAQVLLRRLKELWPEAAPPEQ